MAKFKAPRAKAKRSSARSAIPCLVLVVTGMLLVFLLFWAMIRSAA